MVSNGPKPAPTPIGAWTSRALMAWAALLLLMLTAALAPASAQPKFPTLTGRIVDEAGLLQPADHAAILDLMRKLEEKSTDQIVVYTTKSLQGYPIEDFGYQLGRFWQIGQKDKNNGIILIVAPSDKKVRIEVGRGLEPQMTDLMSGLIVRNVILPAFRRGDFAGGITAGVHDIRDVLLGDTAEVEQRARGGSKRSNDTSGLPIFMIFGLFIVFFGYVSWLQHKQQQEEWARLTPQERNRRIAAARLAREREANIIVIPSGGGSSGGWSWGSGGGGSSDSGWSGGGGDFGGGGASGEW